MSNPTEFFKKIKGACYYSWKKYKILPSVTAAQAAIESGWGESGLTLKANNLFGVKARNGQPSVSMKTKEVYNGVTVVITDSFAKYASWNESFIAHGVLLNNSRYKNCVGMTDPYQQISTIINDGYATAIGYPEMLMSVVNRYKLREWDLDVFAGGDGGGFDGTIGGGIYKNFGESPIKVNSVTRPGTKLKGIQGVVIHAIQSSAGVTGVRNSLDSGNGGVKMGYHLLISESDAQLIVPTTEKVYHAERSASLVGNMPHPNDYTLSVGIVTRNPGDEYGKALNVKVALVLAEFCTLYKIPVSAIMPAYAIDGVKEPLNWYNNPFLFTAFLSMVADAIKEGADVITNPGYNTGGAGTGLGTGGMIPNGTGIIADMIREANSVLGVMTYSGSRPPKIQAGGYGDCSSFCQYLFLKHAKFDIGSVTDTQWFGTWGQRVPVASARAGDLIYFKGTYGHNLSTTHVGLVVSPGTMIDFGHNPGAAINNYNNTYWGPKIVGVKRLFSESEYNESQTGSGSSSTATTPTIDPNGHYVVNVKSPTVVYNADTGGISQARIATDEVYRVTEIGLNSLKLSSGLWVAKTAKSITISKLATNTTPIGTLTTKLESRVYKAPLMSSERAISAGAPKTVAAKSSINVYAIENGFAQTALAQEGVGEEWTVANSTYGDVVLELTEQKVEDIHFDQGVPTETTIRARYVEPDTTTIENNITIPNGLSVFVHSSLLPIGSIISIEIPTAPKYNRTVVVSSNNTVDDDGDVVELIFTSQADQYNLGARTGIIMLLGKLENPTDMMSFFEDPENYLSKRNANVGLGLIKGGEE